MTALQTFKKLIVLSLIGMMMLVVLLATVDVAWIIVQDVLTPPLLLLEVHELLEIFGLIMLVLIGISLLETIKAYLIEDVIHVEIVLEVALIGIARKVIILDVETYSAMSLVGIAALILSVAIAYFFVSRRFDQGKAGVPASE